MRQRRRVVITGLGILAPNGCGKDDFWQACLQGRSGVSAITRFDASILPTRIAGEIAQFSPSAFGLTPTECSVLDRGTQFAVAAANLALQDARNLSRVDLSDEEREHTGVFLGTAMASVEEGERLWLRLTEHGIHPPRALLQQNDATTLTLSYLPAAAIASHHQLHGPCLTIATGCSAGADAIGLAFWKIQEGHAERMLAGGSDAAISLLGLNVFCVLRALSTRNEEPERASRPYDALRDGFVLAEGAAVLLLEEREAALQRGAHIYAEVQCYASNSNAYHMTALPENGMPLQNLLQHIMKESGLQPEQIGYINSHGSSTRLNEVAETAAYKGCFGPQAYTIPISSTKSFIGHTQGAASAIELLITALALDQQILPPTINQEVLDPLCDLDYIPNTARHLDSDHPLNYALAHSSGFGGANAALILARHAVENNTHQNNSDSIVSQQLRSTTMNDTPRRVVITGLGVVAPSGIGKAAFWEALQAGHASIGALSRNQETELPLPFVGEVRDFHVENYIDRKLANRTDRMTHFALAAVQEALQDAQLETEQEDPQRIGAVIANTLGGVEYVTEQIEQLYTRGPRAMSAYTAIAWLHMANVGQTSIRHNFQGYGKVPVNDMCGGLDALGLAYEAIRRGAADVLIAGGSEAPLNPCALHVLSTHSPLYGEAIPHAYRPFDLRGTGPLLAEGAGICVLEDYEHARRRNAPIYGEITGYVQTCAPLDLAKPVLPDVATYARTLRLLFKEANITQEDIASVYLDGRALPAWDASEATALREVFGATFDTLPCSVPRTQFGHSLAASGALDTITALLALREGIVPPTLHCEEPATQYCPPGLVRGNVSVQTEPQQHALICARGLGGSHVMLAVRKV
jgi:3-oxoacyl-(acyl-carrier-protein) synthase